MCGREHDRYDARGRKERSTAPAAGDGGVAETFDAYDDQDDLVTHTDRRGIAHAYRYDHEHRATRYQRAGVTQWTREHDAVGNVLTDTDANAHATTSTYDAANQRVSATRGGQTQRWTYTPTNQVKTHTDASGAVTRCDYNLRDQLLTQTNGANETTTFTVDGDGLQTTRELGGETWTNTFDAAHRLRTVTSPEEHATSYDYNADDALVSITDAEGRVTTQAADSQGRVTERQYPGEAIFSTVYDGNGNAVSDTTPEHGTTRSFDALNRLRSETAGSITRTQSFDGNGNRLTASPGSDTVRTQTYDPHNRPLSDQLQTANSDYTLTATRDANGNRTLSRDARNVATTHTFDAHDRLLTSAAPEGTTANEWNADGTLAQSTQANGVETVYAYDGAKRITSITHRKNGIATLTFGYDYDGRGNRIEETRTEAALPGQAARVQRSVHGYDRDDRLIASTVTYQPSNAQTPDTRTAWTLDAVGNRQTETITELGTNTLRSNKTYTYNERDQLERITDPTNDLQVDYAYDGNGNRTRREVRSANVLTSQVTYTFDARDRLIQAQPNAPNEAIVQYRYDADDRRIARIETPRVNGIPQTPITTRSIYDGSNLLHEADPAQITATYRRSAVLDRHIDHATNTVRHYQLDALRTPVAMTDAAGNTVTATTFDAWGNPTQQTAAGATTIPWSVPQYNPLTTGQAALLNNDSQSIGFTGYGKDSTTGLYYANARWYDPLVGSFNAMDPANGNPSRPVTFHRYLYGNGSPLVYVDRDGRIAVLANGAEMLGQWNGWLQQRAETFDSGVLGSTGSAAIGVTRGLLGLTEGGLRGVNAVANVGVFVHGSVHGLATGALPEYAEGPARELMGTQQSVESAVDYVRDDGLFKSYDAARARTTEAFEGKPGAISDVASALTMTAAAGGSSMRSGLAAIDDAIAARTPTFKPSSLYTHTDDVLPETSAAARTVVVGESPDAAAPFEPQGLTEEPSSFPEGQRLKAHLLKANPQMSGRQANEIARELLRSGINRPRMRGIEQGESLFKVVPKGQSVGERSPYFMDEAQLRALQRGDINIADALGLPVQSESAMYDLYRISPKSGQYPVGFRSTVAPVVQGSTRRVGGATQTLVPNRGQYTDPELVGRLLQE